jgi:Saxitoxin biosynthesis operon protein SxtJ
LSLVSIDWKPEPKALRKFGLVVLIGCGLIGLLFSVVLDRTTVAWAVWTIGAVIGVAGLTGTKIGMPGYWLWMGVGFVMGNIVSRIVVTLIFFGLFTPMGAVRRLLGNDPLSLKRPSLKSYWHPVDPKQAKDLSRYERQF